MRKVIAKKAVWTYIFSIVFTVFVIYYTYNYFSEEFDVKDSMFPLDLIMNIILLCIYIYNIYIVASKPRILLVKEGENFILYPYSSFEIIIPINEVVSASLGTPDSRSKSIITLNTRTRGYQVFGASRCRDVVAEINEIINN